MSDWKQREFLNRKLHNIRMGVWNAEALLRETPGWRWFSRFQLRSMIRHGKESITAIEKELKLKPSSR